MCQKKYALRATNSHAASSCFFISTPEDPPWLGYCLMVAQAVDEHRTIAETHENAAIGAVNPLDCIAFHLSRVVAGRVQHAETSSWWSASRLPGSPSMRAGNGLPAAIRIRSLKAEFTEFEADGLPARGICGGCIAFPRRPIRRDRRAGRPEK